MLTTLLVALAASPIVPFSDTTIVAPDNPADPVVSVCVEVMREELAFDGVSVIVARRACIEALKTRSN